MLSSKPQSLGYSQVLGDPLIVELAAKYKASPAQVVLAWHLARGTTAVPKSTSEAHQKENLNVSATLIIQRAEVEIHPC